MAIESLDLGAVALGTTDETKLQAAHGDPDGAACIGAKAYERQTRMFSLLFTALVWVFSAATVLLLIFAIYKLTKKIDVTSIVSTVGTIASGTAVGFLVKQMNRANALEKQTLAQVELYCGTAPPN